jgi:hypothetical protein
MAVKTARLTTVLAAAGLVILLGSACTKGSPTPTGSTTPGTTPAAGAKASPSAGASATPSPTPPPTDPATVFAADGIGPYLIGTQLTELEGRSLVASVVDSPLCVDTKVANATGRYATQVTLTFTAGRLVWIHTISTDLVTPSGVKVGMPLTDVQTIYGSRGTLITSTKGPKGLVVRVPASTLAVVAFLDPTNTTVASMSGGEADRLETAARTGEGC